MKLLPLVLFLAPLPAYAGGYYYPDSGIVANGRGGAWVASADTYFAQYYNPAALVNVKRPEVAFGFSGVKQNVTFTRMDVDLSGKVTAEHDPIVNQGGLFAVPELGFATPIGDKLAFAFGFTSGFAPDYRFAEDGSQRYTMIDSVIWNFNVGPSLAFRPIPQVSFGLGLQWQVLRVEERLKVTTMGVDNPDGDVAVDARVWDKFTPGFNVGLLVEPVEKLSIGLSVQPPASYEARGQGQLDFTGHAWETMLDQVVWTDDDVSLALAMPLFVKSGVAVRPAEGLEVEVDFIYETWSRLTDIIVGDIDVTITGANGAINQPVDDQIALPAGFNDAWSLRMGGEYRVNPLLEVRAGGFYETGALKPREVSVALVDTNKFGTGAGLSLFLPGGLVLDGYGSAVLYRPLKIRNSEVTQINVFDPEQKIVVGNGDIQSTGFAMGGAIRKRFGKS